MLGAIKHRGPDGSGHIAAGGGRVHLTHSRLSILDLSPAGSQPMTDSTGLRFIVYNGEAFNAPELRRQMQEYPFKSHTDTEVVLVAYLKYGSAALSALRGMFAFAIWDEEKRELLIARDPLGIKPLYFKQSETSFVFASEIRAIAASGLVERRADPAAIGDYLRFGSTQGERTILNDVRSLVPGSLLCVRVDGDRLTYEKKVYFDPVRLLQNQSRRFQAKRSVDSVSESLSDAVGGCLLSDVPVGLFLSGGVDSTLLGLYLTRKAHYDLQSFTVSWDGPASDVEHDVARKAAELIGCRHTEVKVSEDEVTAAMSSAVDAWDSPSADGLNTYLISKVVRGVGIKVALSGLGADEIFAGYPSFRRAYYGKWLRFLSPGVSEWVGRVGGRVARGSRSRKFCRLLATRGAPGPIYEVTREVFSAGEIEVLFQPSGLESAEYRCDFLEDATHDRRDPVNVMSILELTRYMANTLLRDTDGMSMHHGLEVRVPYVDPAVVAAALAVPGHLKISRRVPKPLLLEAFGKDLPPEIWRRPKMGFALPIGRWLTQQLKGEVTDVLRDRTLCLRAGLDVRQTSATYHQYLQSPWREHWMRPWSLYVLLRWIARNDISL